MSQLARDHEILCRGLLKLAQFETRCPQCGMMRAIAAETLAAIVSEEEDATLAPPPMLTKHGYDPLRAANEAVTASGRVTTVPFMGTVTDVKAIQAEIDEMDENALEQAESELDERHAAAREEELDAQVTDFVDPRDEA